MKSAFLLYFKAYLKVLVEVIAIKAKADQFLTIAIPYYEKDAVFCLFNRDNGYSNKQFVSKKGLGYYRCF